MKRLLLLALIAALAVAALAGTGVAQADPTGNETCGGSVDLLDYSWDFYATNAWDVHEQHFCSDNKTFSYEVQHTTDGGLHWSDWTPDTGYRSGACSGGCNADHELTNSTCPNTGSYRVHFWWSGGDLPTDKVGAGIVCGANIQYN